MVFVKTSITSSFAALDCPNIWMLNAATEIWSVSADGFIVVFVVVLFAESLFVELSFDVLFVVFDMLVLLLSSPFVVLLDSFKKSISMQPEKRNANSSTESRITKTLCFLFKIFDFMREETCSQHLFILPDSFELYFIKIKNE